MKLTKEECEKALSVLKEQHDYLSFMLHSNYPYSIEMIKIVQSCFEQLINEHFDNPPLKFEELKEGMWVWDNVKNEYMPIDNVNKTNRCFNEVTYCSDIWGDEDYDYIKFEENRFYRREVQYENS